MDINVDLTSVLFWAPIILLLCSCPQPSEGEDDRACPQGQIIHIEEKTYCCYPTRCGVGEKVEVCKTNGTHDTCQRCPQYFNQSQRTSSFNMMECTNWPFDHECKSRYSEKLETSDVRTKRCLCNIEYGLLFDAPEVENNAPHAAYCQRNTKECKPGEEPTVNGSCRPCAPHYFKAEKGFRLCEQKTNCGKLGLNYTYESRKATEDNKCSPVPPSTRTSPTEPSVPYNRKPPDPNIPPLTKKPGRPTTTSRPTGVIGPGTTAGGVDTNGDGKERIGSSVSTNGGGGSGSGSNSSLVGPIVGSIVFLLVVIIVIAVILFYRKHRGLSFCCGTVKTCSDPEKNMRHNPSLMAEPHQRNKIIQGNSSGFTSTNNDKPMNNNTANNGRLAHSYTNHQQGGSGDTAGDTANHNQLHHNSNHQHGGNAAFYQQQQQLQQAFPPSNMFPPSPGPSPRQGILRNGHSQWQTMSPVSRADSQTLDSIAREKLQVHCLTREANVEAGGEGDPLLVSEPAPPRTATPLAGGSALQGLNARRLPHPHHSNSSSSGGVEVTFAPQATTYVHAGGPPGVVATFTRSSSVIATPEGEVDEDDLEARVPRFSQLLPDPEASPDSNAVSPESETPNQRRTDETATTQQMRSPSQRLLQWQPTPVRAPQTQVASPTVDSQPDHHIMTLKEQQLSESLPPPASLPSYSLPTHCHSSGSETQALKTNTSGNRQPSTQETDLKTHVSPIDDLSVESSIGGNKGGKQTDSTSSKESEQGKPQGGSRNQAAVNKKSDFGSTGSSNHTNSLAARDRRRMASGGSTTSNTSSGSQGHNIEPLYGSGGDDEDNSATAQANTTRKLTYPETASFEEKDEESQGVPEAEFHSAENVEETQQKNVSSPDDALSSGSQGTSPESSPNRTNVYRRSQSENVPSGSESAHKPPPRSNSEEKPQSASRPIAKVRPMPATDSQLPVEVSDGVNLAAIPGNILSYSSDESDGEEEDADHPSDGSGGELESAEDTQSSQSQRQESDV